MFTVWAKETMLIGILSHKGWPVATYNSFGYDQDSVLIEGAISQDYLSCSTVRATYPSLDCLML